MLPYFLIALPVLLVGLAITIWSKIRVSKPSVMVTQKELTGAEFARFILGKHGLDDAQVEVGEDFLTNYYDPQSKALRLTPDVYYSSSVPALGTAAHISAHAIQGGKEVFWTDFRNKIALSVQVGSWLGPSIVVIGLIFFGETVALFGLALFLLAAILTLFLLPIEVSAGARAKNLIRDASLLQEDEKKMTCRVIDVMNLNYIVVLTQAIYSWPFILFRPRGRSAFWNHDYDSRPRK